MEDLMEHTDALTLSISRIVTKVQMRTFLKLSPVVLSLLLVAGLYGGVSLLAASSSAPAPAITYKVVPVTRLEESSMEIGIAAMQSILDDSGKDGWELVLFDVHASVLILGR